MVNNFTKCYVFYDDMLQISSVQFYEQSSREGFSTVFTETSIICNQIPLMRKFHLKANVMLYYSLMANYACALSVGTVCEIHPLGPLTMVYFFGISSLLLIFYSILLIYGFDNRI